LVDGAGVVGGTLLEQVVIGVALAALAAEAIDGVEALGAVAVSGEDIENLVDAAAVAFGLEAVFYYGHGGSAAGAVLGEGGYC